MMKGVNLLKNSFGKDGINCWDVQCSGGDGFKVEETAVGCKPFMTAADKKTLPCWATSYKPCEKLQLISLVQSGYSEKLLDNWKPTITVVDWYASRNDCGAKYRIKVRLLGADKKTELVKWEFSTNKNAGDDWIEARHVFRCYASGVRYVEFFHGGEDSKGWAGHYGIKMTNSGVFVETAIKDVLGNNLIKNPSGKFNLEDWEVTSSGGDGFDTEKEAIGSKQVSEVIPEADGNSCWATSFGWCEKKQLIDLKLEGFDADFMDKVVPEIKISEWVASRFDVDRIKYWMSVRLLDGDKKEIAKIEFNESNNTGGDWIQVSDSFVGYGPGARFIEYTHGGQDRCFWKGHYGAKITCSSVKINI